ncbi:MAG: hypothetical protein ACO1RA_04160 [Planctomycetaceae bacterium]
MSASDSHPASGTLGPSSFITQQVSRVRRNLLIANGICLAILLFIAWLASGYFYFFFRGPKEITGDQLVELAQNPGNGNLLEYVRFPDQEMLPTGIQEESTTDDKVYSVNPYYLVAIGEKLLLVKTEKPVPPRFSLLGPVSAISVKSDVEARDLILQTRPDLRQRLLPITLNGAAAFNVAGYIGVAFLLPFFVLCSYNIVRGLHGPSGLALHPVTRSLSRLGDVLQVASQIDAEVQKGTMYKLGKTTVTEQWLLIPTTFGLTVVSLPNIVWGYHLVVGQTHAIVLQLHTKSHVAVNMADKEIDALLREIHSRVPWIKLGYNSELYRNWQKNRDTIIAEVDQKMQAYLAQQK